MADMLWIGVVCVVLGQCLAGICENFAAFLVCQGVVFGIGESDSSGYPERY